MRLRPSSSRSATTVMLLIATLGLLAACRPGSVDPGGSGDALPTGLVGPVAPTVGPQALRYVALGDSYTFGDGVRQRERWPNQLVHILRPELDLDLAANLGARSIASLDVITEQLPELRTLRPQFVSLQVGANDACLYKPGTPADFEENIGEILDTVLGLVDAQRAVVLTIPDFTLTPSPPASCAGDLVEQAARIRELNAILSAAAGARGVAVVDVSPIADRVAVDRTLVTSDGTYPSGKQYAGWADLAALTIRRLFASPAGSAAGAAQPTGPPGLPPPTMAPTPLTTPDGSASPPPTSEPVFLTSRA